MERDKDYAVQFCLDMVALEFGLPFTHVLAGHVRAANIVANGIFAAVVSVARTDQPLEDIDEDRCPVISEPVFCVQSIGEEIGVTCNKADPRDDTTCEEGCKGFLSACFCLVLRLAVDVESCYSRFCHATP